MSSYLRLPKVGLDAVKKNKVGFARELAAEFVGTMLLVMIGCGSTMSGDEDDGEGQLGEQALYVRIALGFGLAYATIAQAVGHVSGCQINPAITVGLVAGAKVEVIRGFAYVLAQSIGGLLGGAILKALLPCYTRGKSGLGATALGEGVSASQVIQYCTNWRPSTLMQGFGVEFFISFVPLMVIFGAAENDSNTVNEKGSSSLAIGLSITACHLFAIPLTGSRSVAITFA